MKVKCYIFFSSIFSDIPIWMNEWGPTSIEHQIGRLPTASTIPYEMANNPLWDILSAILETCASECHLRKTMASQVLVVVKNPPANAGNVRESDSILGSGRPFGGHGNPLLYTCLENPMDWRAWQGTVPRVAKKWTWLKLLSTMENSMAVP